MNSRPSFSLGRALSAAFASLPAAWGGAWGVLLLWCVLAVVLPQLHIQIVPVWVLDAGTALLVLILQYIAYGALYRIALFGRDARKHGLGFGGLQLGGAEVRLFLADLIVALFGLLVAAADGVVFLIAFNTAGMAEGHSDTIVAIEAMFKRHEGKDWIFIGYLLAAWVFLIFVGLKFALMAAANVAERRLVTLNALGLSSGNVGKLFIGLVILSLPVIILLLCGIAAAGIMGIGLSGANMGGSAALFVHQAILVFLYIPIMIGFLSSAYGQIVASRTR